METTHTLDPPPNTKVDPYQDPAYNQPPAISEIDRAESHSLTLSNSLHEADFPLGGTPEAKLRFLLNYAILAPSNRNTQPWQWRFAGDTVELYADLTRALPHLDPNGRELTLSCGAALLHLRLAMRHFGYRDEVKAMPAPDDPNLLAVVRLGEEAPPSAEEELLFEAIPRRHTNRHPFQERELPDALKSAMQQEAEREGAWLQFIEDNEARMAIIDLIAKSDRVQGHDSQFLQETANWIRPSRAATADGIPEYALGNGGLVSHYATDLGEALADKDRLLAWSAAALVVLETADDTPREWLAAGQALARVLLRASAEGVQASFLNSPVEVVEMWPQLHHVLKRAGLPQFILRLGYPAQETGPTPRRSVSEVTQPVAGDASTPPALKPPLPTI